MSDLHLPLDNKKRLTAASNIYDFFKDAIEISNANIIHNVDYYLRKSKKDFSNISWIGKAQK